MIHAGQEPSRDRRFIFQFRLHALLTHRIQNSPNNTEALRLSATDCRCLIIPQYHLEHSYHDGTECPRVSSRIRRAAPVASTSNDALIANRWPLPFLGCLHLRVPRQGELSPRSPGACIVPHSILSHCPAVPVQCSARTRTDMIDYDRSLTSICPVVLT